MLVCLLLIFLALLCSIFVNMLIYLAHNYTHVHSLSLSFYFVITLFDILNLMWFFILVVVVKQIGMLLIIDWMRLLRNTFIHFFHALLNHRAKRDCSQQVWSVSLTLNYASLPFTLNTNHTTNKVANDSNPKSNNFFFFSTTVLRFEESI